MNPILIIFVTLAVAGIIMFAKKVENPLFVAVLIILNLGLLIYHSCVLNSIPSESVDAISDIYLCIAMDFLWLLISFLAYLWIDDITARKFNKKSYDNSLSWFWEKL